MKIGVLAVLALVGAAPVPAQTPAVGSWHEQVQRLRRAHPTAAKVKTARRLAVPRRAASESMTLAEQEPNNTVATADSAMLGDQATGVVNPPGDVDTWFLDLTAGQFVSIDVDANEVGSPLDPVISLIAPDGVTLLAFNDDFDGLDSRISYRVAASGRYYVAIRAFGNVGSPELAYTINFGTVTCIAVGTEQEPNGTPGTATPVAIGDSGSGELCPPDDSPGGDVDYWAFTAQAGTTIELDIDAAEFGLLVDPFLALFASDGATRLAFNDDADGSDSRLQYSIVATGTYYVAVTDVVGNGGNPFPYTLHVRSITPGPGDPITVRADGLGLPLGIAAGSTGDLFVGDLSTNRVVRIYGQGVVTTFAAPIPSPLGLAFDAFGHLLVVSGDGNVYRVTPQGQATPFITDAGIPFGIAVAPDGRIWLTDLSDRSLRRYSSTGQFETRFDAIVVGGAGPGPLTIGPSGVPYFSQGTEIWKLVNGQFERVLTDRFIVWGFAFDVAGNIYAPAPVVGRIELFGPTGAKLADPFAVGPDAPQALAFGRDGTGATVARVFATEPRMGRVIEVNPAGVAHPGLPVGFTAAFTPEVAAASLLGGGGLSAADLQFLDALGNRNGRFDVGDLRAYLATLGGLPGTAAAAVQRRPGSDR